VASGAIGRDECRRLREALEAAQEVEIAPSLVVRVASLSGLAVLKLLAWADRGIEDPRDATDLVIIMRRYVEAGNEDRLYGEEADVLDTVAHDVDLAGPRLLGKDAADSSLTRLVSKSSPCFAMTPSYNASSKTWRGRFAASRTQSAEAERLLAQFRSGLEEPDE